MSFRKVGGVQYSATQNVVKSRYNTTDNLYVNKYVGEPNTVIDFLSDISGNIIIYGDLDVSGNLYTAKDAYINSVRVGRGGGDDISNTVVGYTALNSNIIGRQNTAVGYLALRNTDASFNTAVGHLALYSNTTGSYNTAIGNSALQHSTTAINCVAVGHGALTDSTGINNTAVGSVAMNFGTTGDNNVAIGTSSLEYNSGNNNTAVGYASTFSNTIGNNNVSLGFQAGFDLSGNSNFNTFLGSTTDVDSSLNIYNYSTALGYGAIIDASNKMVFGTSTEKIKIPGSYVGIGGVYNPSSGYTLDVSGILQVQNGTTDGFGALYGLYVSPSRFFYDSNNPTDIDTFKIELAGANCKIYKGVGTFGGSATIIQNNGTAGGIALASQSTFIYVNQNNSTPGMGIMTTTPAYTLDVSGNMRVTDQVYAAGYTVISDYRIKENAVKLDETFTVDNLRPVTYKNIKIEKQDIGLIAHELQEVYPFLVTGEKDGENLQSVNYNGIIGILIKEIQVLKERVKILEQKPLLK